VEGFVFALNDKKRREDERKSGKKWKELQHISLISSAFQNVVK
jgi:hypothetical protein